MKLTKISNFTPYLELNSWRLHRRWKIDKRTHLDAQKSNAAVQQAERSNVTNSCRKIASMNRLLVGSILACKKNAILLFDIAFDFSELTTEFFVVRFFPWKFIHRIFHQ